MPSPTQRKETRMFVLPYPPSMNSYWRRNRGRFHISMEGQRYREVVAAELVAQRVEPFTDGERLKLIIFATMPDRRLRDIDNIQKPVLDALEKAGLFDDDHQIDDLRTVREAVLKPGSLELVIQPTEPI